MLIAILDTTTSDVVQTHPLTVHDRETLIYRPLRIVSFRQGSRLLWSHTLRPFYSKPIVLTQERRSLVNDVCECVRD